MTNRSKAVAKKILQNPSLEIGAVMKEVGYSENTRPHDLTNTKGWAELMEEYLPDKDILSAHKNGLKAMKTITSHTEPDKEVEDHAIRLKAVELAYRVKKKMDQSIGIQVNNIIGQKKENYGI